MPLILGMESDPKKTQKVLKDGTRLFSHDLDGKCFLGGGSSDIREYSQKVLQFEQHSLLSCKVEFDKTELEAYCSGAKKEDYKDWKMFA